MKKIRAVFRRIIRALSAGLSAFRRTWNAADDVPQGHAIRWPLSGLFTAVSGAAEARDLFLAAKENGEAVERWHGGIRRDWWPRCAVLFLLACSAPASAQTVGQQYREPIRIVEVVRTTVDSVWYRVLHSEASPTTIGRTYPATLNGWKNARWVTLDSVAPDTVKPPAPPVVVPPVDTPKVAPLYATDFETTQAGGCFSWGSVSSRVAPSTTHAYSGRQSVRFRYGPDADGADSSAEQRFTIACDAASAPKEIWVEFMLRVPDNYVHRNSSGPDNNKLAAFWAESYNASTTETLVVLEYERRVENGSSFLRVSSAMADGYETRNPDRVQTAQGTLFDESMRGKWVRIRTHLKSAVNASVVDVWRDSTLIARLPQDYSITAPGWPRGYFRHGYLLGWSNSGFTDVTDFYVDDFKLYDRNPGWVF